MPTGQVFKWHLRIITQPRAISGAVAKPYSSAPSSAAIATSRPVLILPPALDWVPVKRSVAAQEAPFSATKWIAEAGANTPAKAVSHLERRFLRVPLSDSKRAEVIAFLESNDWARPSQDGKVSKDGEHKLRRALHLILCTPEFQMH